MIVLATLLCDRKQSSWLAGLPTMIAQDYPGEWQMYINIETNSLLDQHYDPVFDALNNSGKIFHFDMWSNLSSWWKKPTYDQDQARLTPIVRARNMALEFARASSASHIFFVDSDVKIPSNALSKLVAADKQMVGGVVNGRGVHRAVRYIFGETSVHEGPLWKVGNGTLGCMLIRWDVFKYLSFRWGPSIKEGTMLSEDPAYCNDAKVLLNADFWIHTEVICDHWDDPAHPLTTREVAGF